MSEIFAANVSVNVSKYIIVETGKQAHTFYQIDLTINNQNFNVSKRFKDFETLHSKLKKKCTKIPDLPPKHIMSRATKALENRRQALNTYMNKLVTSFDRYLPDELVQFFNFQENALNYEQQQQQQDELESDELLLNFPLISIKDVDISKLDIECSDIITKGILAQLYS